MENQDITALKRKRESLKMRIKYYMKKNQNPRELVVEYQQVISDLRKRGLNVENRVDYLEVEYWNKPKSERSSNIGLTTEKIDNIKPLQDSFILCLAWTASMQNEIPEQVKKVMDYFKELELPLIDEEVGEINQRMEHVMRYEFKGTDDAFRLLKICVQFVLDSFAQTDFDKFNIAVYGKKKKY